MYYKLICIILTLSTFLFGQTETPPTPQIDPFAIQEPPPEVINDNRFLGEFFYMLLMLGILIAALLFATRFLRRMLDARYDQLNDTSTIKLLERRQLSQRTTLYLLESEGKKLLIAETPTHVTLLDESKTGSESLQS